MKTHFSIRNKLIFFTFVGCLIPYVLGGVYLNSFLTQWVENSTRENTQRLLNQISSLIDESLITNSIQQVEMLSLDERILTADNTLNNYVGYDSSTFTPSYSSVESDISGLFGTLKASKPTVNFIFLGTDSGAYIEYPQFNPTGPYDPRERPWYKNTLATSDVLISDPYLSKVTEELIISFTKKVTFRNAHTGVVGLSMKIADLTTHLAQMQLGSNGYILILNPNDLFIVSPKNKEWILKTPTELNLPFLTNLNHYSQDTFQGTIQGEEKIFHLNISTISGWKVISVHNKNDLTTQTNTIRSIILGIYSLTLLFIFFILYFIAERISSPILIISKTIDRIDNFHFDLLGRKEFEKYLQRNDEIGTISQAINLLVDNFAELDLSITDIDKKIQTIDIASKVPDPLEISESNPFYKVIVSMNMLLEKIQGSFQQLQSSHLEISDKNELLVASEEELTAQLTEIESQRNVIQFLAYHDPLTSLPNRRQFIQKLEASLENQIKGAILLVDLDNFKGINDTLGHVFGDKVLRIVADKFDTLSTEEIFISRFGGDEFLILYNHINERDELVSFIGSLRRIFSDYFLIDELPMEVSFSIGITVFPDDSNDTNQLIMNADLALYAAKNKGKNGYLFFDTSMADHVNQKSTIEGHIKGALDNNGFKLLYQPQVEVTTGEIIAYEALIRFKNHPIGPAEFIPIAEENGLIIRIGRYVVEEVCRQLREWINIGYKVKPVSINFSANQMHDIHFIDYVTDALSSYQIDPHLIEFEITESIFLENKDITLIFLAKLRELGFKISIDDFGTGYSSLSYLTFLPIDKIKLDRSLNDRFLQIQNIKVIDSLISLAHSLNLEVVAEGIETLDQVKKLLVGQCDLIQGYYFSKPLEPEDVEKSFSTDYKSLIK